MKSNVGQRTRAFARVLGPFFTIITVVVILRASDMRQLLTEFTASDVWPWVTGAFILMGGIAIVAFHQYWRGAPAIIVSVLGWLLVVRGILLIAFPNVFASVADRMVGATGAWTVAYILMALIGLYLTYVGWRPGKQDDELHISIDLPRAA
ncbi:hypothetical protein [Mycolicibacterium stellerae]|uniref:hypothetical protein n=1 Tax=Mycolicibacterium stellerae TaxID=2358193 RepID=UPI000F0B2F8F|nr:hypothetical protein [Mycolicibacterium stellerae]